MTRDEAERYALGVRDRVFNATIGAIANMEHPKGASEQARTLSFYATIDALLKVVGELVAEAEFGENTGDAVLADLKIALVRHFGDAKQSIEERRHNLIN